MLEQENEILPEQPAEQPEEQPAATSSNRTFTIAVGILGGLVLLTIICVLVYAFIIGPRLSSSSASAQTTAEAHNAQIAQAMTATMEASLWTATALPTSVVPATRTPSPTAVVNLPSQTPTDVYDSMTATMEALYTQAAIAQLTPTSTLVLPEGSLPEGGFTDRYGIPGLLIIAAVLVVVIFMARRMRMNAG